MSEEAARQAVFRRLPLRAQKAFIAATRSHPDLSKDNEYLEALERIHQECLAEATPAQRAQYEKF